LPDGIRINAARAGGTLLDGSNDQFTIIPVVLMKEKVTNGALKRYEEFSNDAHWAEGIPIVGPHIQGQPPTNHLSPKAGKIRNIRLNSELKRVEGEAVIFNKMIDLADLERIKSGEQFAGSIGYFCNEEKLQSPQKWIDGEEYTIIEKAPFFFDHFSMVAHGACDLPQCGFNVNAKEPDNMAEPVITPPAGNPAPTVAPPVVEPLKVNALTEEKLTGVFSAFELKMNARFDAIDATIAAKDAEIKTLKAAEEVRVNAKNAAEDALVLSTLDSLLLPAFKDKKAELFPAFKANAALFIAQNPDKIDLAAFTKPPVITPSGQAFVPHVNASEDEELKGLMPTDEEAGMRKVA
jgi:hypothetical protein